MLKITAPYKQDDNFITIYDTNRVYTIAKNTGSIGYRNVGECGYDSHSHELGKLECTKIGTFCLDLD